MTTEHTAPRPATPTSHGYRHAAEWEPHEATWIGWPHNRSDWPGKFAPIQWVYGEIVKKVSAGEKVRVFVEDAEHEASARKVLVKIGVLPEIDRKAKRKKTSKKKDPVESPVEFFRIPTNRGWTRDFGPFFLLTDSPTPSKATVRFAFNGWAKYPDWKLDNKAAAKATKSLKLDSFDATINGRRFVLEGGSIDVNGRGSLLTTEECLLDPQVQTRNPGMSKDEIESVLRDFLGVSNILWLGRGIAGDDTHGHIDDLCRFVGHNTVLLCSEDNSLDDNYELLQENRERLEGMRLEDGSKIEVVSLPMPAPLYFEGRRLPASYANFYICNAAVLVPTFNDPNDRIALGVLSELITDRPVIGIHAVDLVWGLGTLHCLTHEEPSVVR